MMLYMTLQMKHQIIPLMMFYMILQMKHQIILYMILHLILLMILQMIQTLSNFLMIFQMIIHYYALDYKIKAQHNSQMKFFTFLALMQL